MRKTMGKMTLLLACALFFVTAAQAQSPAPSPSPAPAQLPARVDAPPEVQAAFQLSQSKIAAAEATLKAARLEQENLILRTALLTGVPAEYNPRLDEQGRLYFEKPQTRVGSQEPPPAKRP